MSGRCDLRVALAWLVAGLLALTACSGTSPNPTVDSPLQMDGASMEPTIENGELVEIIGYGDDKPQADDIVAFTHPLLSHRTVVKRIVAQSGDTVEVRDGGIVVNGVDLDEPYTLGETRCATTCSWILPPAGSSECPTICYFVLGDRRQNSADSRQDWLVPEENILGWIDR